MRVWPAIFLVSMVACGDSGPRPPPLPPGDAGTDPPVGRTLVLVEPASPVMLAADEAVTLRFLVTSLGEPVPDALVACSYHGHPADASLEPPTLADETGEATAELRAGSEPAFFRVHCSTLGSSIVELHVAISPSGGYGALLVEPSYDGSRAFEATMVEVHYGQGCEPTLAPPLSIEAEPGTPARVEPVPVELSPTLVVSLLDASGDPVARGCLEGTTVSASEEVSVVVPVSDLPLRIDGERAASLTLSSEEAPVFAGEAGRAAALAEIEAFGDEVDTMLAALRAELSARGFDVDLLTLDQDLADNYAVQLADAYALDGTGPTVAVDAMATLASGALTLEGVLAIDPAPEGGYALAYHTAALFAGEDAGPVARSSFAGDPDGAGAAPALELGVLRGELQFDFGGGALAAAGIMAALDPATRDALALSFGCSTFAELPSFEGTFVECEADCRLEVCEAAFGRVLDAYLDGVSSSTPGESLLLELELVFEEDGGLVPSNVTVERAVARFVEGETLVELLAASLELSP